MENFYSRCLLCTCTSDVVTPHLHIFSEAGNQLHLSEKINKYLNIQIVAELPQNVCRSCMEKLEVTHELVTSSQQARVTLLQIKQQIENFGVEIKQEITDSSMMELDTYQPSTESFANYNESCMDFKTNEISMANTNCSAKDFGQLETNTAFNSAVERTEVNTVPFQEVLISKIDIEDRVIEQEPGGLLHHKITVVSKSSSNRVNDRGRRFRNLKCAECEVNYIYPEMLMWHTKNCHGNDANVKVIKINQRQHTFQCLLCETILRSQELTIKHLQCKHKISDLPFKCNLCDKSFLHKSESIKHQFKCKARKVSKFDNIVDSKHSQINQQVSNAVYKCQICNDVFDSEMLLKCHVSIFHDKKRRELHLKCGHCVKSFHSFPSLKSHCLSNHPGKYILQCEKCKTTFTTYDGYSKHKKYSHAGEHEFNCPICDTTCSNSDTLEQHIRNMHSQSIQISCNFCDATFKRKSDLQNHIRDVHTDPVLNCEFCLFKTRKKIRLDNHLNSKHYKLNQTLSCEYCTDVFKSKSTLYRHVRDAHVSLLHCPHCSYSTTRKYHIDQHIKLRHTHVPKTFPCTFCGVMFKCKQYVQQHVRTMHTGPKLHCAHCKHSTRRKDDLLKHIRLTHLPSPKILVCGYCAATFTCGRYLKQHVNDTHTGKILNCEYCQYSTRRKCNLKMHFKNVHPTSK